jgi:cell division protein FtsW
MNRDARPVPDLTLALTALMLLAVGLVLIYSSSAILAMGRWGDSFYFIKRQLLFASLGIFVLVGIVRLQASELRDWSGALMLAVLVLLALTLIPGIGKVAGGARRWLGAGPLRFQPSELAKIALVLFSADRLSRPGGPSFTWKAGVQPVLLATALACGLTLLEPDFGSCVMMVLIVAGMLYCAGLDAKLFVVPALIGVPAAVFLVLHSAYRMRRIAAFLDPWKDPDGTSFQIVHSMMAFGTGGLLGQGLGEGKQKLYYLPEPHTDFIFSTAGEEFGFLGCMVLLFLFMLLCWRGLMIALKNKDSFLKLGSVGMTLMLGLQVLVNLFVVLGLAPTKGTTLPFLSSGGSALLVDLAVVGLLLNFSKEAK